MKFIFFTFVFVVFVHALDIKSAQDVVMRDGIIYKQFDTKYFTGIGKVKESNKENGCVITYMQISNGIIKGEVEMWTCDGNLIAKTTIINNHTVGKNEAWDKNGVKTRELFYDTKGSVISGWEKATYNDEYNLRPEMKGCPELELKYVNGKYTGTKMLGEDKCFHKNKLSFYANDKFVKCIECKK